MKPGEKNDRVVPKLPNRRKTSSNIVRSTSAFLAVSLTILSAACSGSGGDSPSPSNQPAVTQSPAATQPPASPAANTAAPAASPTASARTGNEPHLSILELTAAYVNDEALANKTYKGKQITLTGRVESVLPDGPPPVGSLKQFSGQPLVFFRGQTIACLFSSKEAAAAVPTRQRVTVVGRVEGRIDSRVILKNCELQDVAERNPNRKNRVKIKP